MFISLLLSPLLHTQFIGVDSAVSVVLRIAIGVVVVVVVVVPLVGGGPGGRRDVATGVVVVVRVLL